MMGWINSISPIWWSLFTVFTIQNVLFLSLIFLILKIFNQSPPRLLKMICLVGLTKLFIPPFLPFPEFSTVLPAPMRTFGSFTMQPIMIDAQVSYTTPHMYSILMLTYISVVTALILFTIIKNVRIRREIREGEKIFHDRANKIQIYKSNQLKIPHLFGLFNFYLVVPANWDDWDNNIKQSVINHEKAHLIEKDHYINFLKLMAIAVHFYNPLVWLLIKRLDLYSELICDDYAIESTQLHPHDYNYQILKISEYVQYDLPGKIVLPFSKTYKLIKNRILYQLNKKESTPMRKHSFQSILGLSLLGLSTLLFSWQCQNTAETKGPEVVHEVKSDAELLPFHEIDVKPTMLEKINPVYPDSARISGIEGIVVVTVIINENGDVESAKIFKSVEGLDKAALEAALACKFSPAMHQGKAVKVAMNIPFAFMLHKDQ